MHIFRFAVDEAFAREHNEMLKDTRRLQLSAVVLGVLLIAVGAVAAVLAQGAVWGWLALGVMSIVGIIFFAVAAVVPKQVGTAQQLYDTFPLIPAVVAEVNPRDMVIMGLVNLNVDPQARPVWGVALRTVTRIPGVKPKLGTRLPAVAVSGQRRLRTKDRWTEISPMPIAWGTPDREVVAAARKAIPQSQWAKLEKALPRLAEVQKTPFNLLEL